MSEQIFYPSPILMRSLFPMGKANKFQVLTLGFVKDWVGTSFALIHVDI